MSLFITLSKTLPLLLLPPGLGLCFLLLGLVQRRRLVRPVLLWLSLPALLLPSLPIVSDGLLQALERRYPLRSAADSPSADAIIILGGGTAGRSPSRPEVDLQASGTRLLHGFRLYKQGKAPLLVLSGGSLYPGDSEALQMGRILNEWGIPKAAMVYEDQSRNTHENAVEALRLCRARGLRRVLLVTSAFHMPRALAIFRHEAARGGPAVDIIAAPTGAQVSGERHGLLGGFLPEAGALANSSMALREQLGFVIYGLRGWL